VLQTNDGLAEWFFVAKSDDAMVRPNLRSRESKCANAAE
jgi:hypothetical protein